MNIKAANLSLIAFTMLVLSNGALANPSDVTCEVVQDGTILCTGVEECRPWTDGVHFEIAKQNADQLASQTCAALPTRRVSSYTLHVAPGSQCFAKANYICGN